MPNKKKKRDSDNSKEPEKGQVLSFDYPDADFKPSILEFDDDGECTGDSTWDYPGSPYLGEDDDIY